MSGRARWCLPGLKSLLCGVRLTREATNQREGRGLRADVICMSGGRIGHLANAIMDDPVIKERGEISVVTALIDVRAPYANNNEFVFAIENGLEKLSGEVAKYPGKHLVLHSVLPQALNPAQELRMEFLTRALGDLQSDCISGTAAPARDGGG